MLNISLLFLLLYQCTALQINSVTANKPANQYVESSSSDQLADLPSLKSVARVSTPIVGLGLLVQFARKFFGKAAFTNYHLRKLMLGYVLICLWRVFKVQDVECKKVIKFEPPADDVCRTCHGTGLAKAASEITETKGYRSVNDPSHLGGDKYKCNVGLKSVVPGQKAGPFSGACDGLVECMYCQKRWEQALTVSDFKVGVAVRHMDLGFERYRPNFSGVQAPAWQTSERDSGYLGKVIRVDDFPEQGYSEVEIFWPHSVTMEDKAPPSIYRESRLLSLTTIGSWLNCYGKIRDLAVPHWQKGFGESLWKDATAVLCWDVGSKVRSSSKQGVVHTLLKPLSKPAIPFDIDFPDQAWNARNAGKFFRILWDDQSDEWYSAEQKYNFKLEQDVLLIDESKKQQTLTAGTLIRGFNNLQVPSPHSPSQTKADSSLDKRQIVTSVAHARDDSTHDKDHPDMIIQNLAIDAWVQIHNLPRFYKGNRFDKQYEIPAYPSELSGRIGKILSFKAPTNHVDQVPLRSNGYQVYRQEGNHWKSSIETEDYVNPIGQYGKTTPTSDVIDQSLVKQLRLKDLDRPDYRIWCIAKKFPEDDASPNLKEAHVKTSYAQDFIEVGIPVPTQAGTAYQSVFIEREYLTVLPRVGSRVQIDSSILSIYPQFKDVKNFVNQVGIVKKYNSPIYDVSYAQTQLKEFLSVEQNRVEWEGQLPELGEMQDFIGKVMFLVQVDQDQVIEVVLSNVNVSSAPSQNSFRIKMPVWGNPGKGNHQTRCQARAFKPPTGWINVHISGQMFSANRQQRTVSGEKHSLDSAMTTVKLLDGRTFHIPALFLTPTRASSPGRGGQRRLRAKSPPAVALN